MGFLRNYETVGNILREAGFLFLARREECEIDGDTIIVNNSNIVPKNCVEEDGDVTNGDVVVVCNGEKLKVKEVDPLEGVITLEEPPVRETSAKVSYRYSTVEIDYAKKARDDVQELIDAKLLQLGNRITGAQGKLRLITRLWAGGLLLSREYGYNTDNDEGAVDGYKKIEEAKSLLDELIKELMTINEDQDDVNGGAGCVLARSEGDLFENPSKKSKIGSEW